MSRPSYDDGRCAVWHACAEAWLPTVADASVDLILTDPPFCGVKDEEWDRQWKDEAHYLRWLGGIADEWRRVLKPNGSLYCFASPQMAARVEIMLGERFTVLNRITWRKPPYSTKAEMFRKEDMRAFFPASEAIIFCEQRQGGLSPLAAHLRRARVVAGLTCDAIERALGYTDNRGCGSRLYYRWETGDSEPSREDFGRAMRVCGADGDYDDLHRPFILSPRVAYTDVWDYQTVNTYPGKHVCEKPITLLEHCITASTRPDGLVLDSFLGSGNTLRAAKNLGRRGIGCEADARWARKAGERCRQESFAFDAEAAG